MKLTSDAPFPVYVKGEQSELTGIFSPRLKSVIYIHDLEEQDREGRPAYNEEIEIIWQFRFRYALSFLYPQIIARVSQ